MMVILGSIRRSLHASVQQNNSQKKWFRGQRPNNPLFKAGNSDIKNLVRRDQVYKMSDFANLVRGRP